jgi:hypothetical protein
MPLLTPHLWLLELLLEIAIPAAAYFLIWFGRRLFYPRVRQFQLPQATTYGTDELQHSIQETRATPLLPIQLESPYRASWTRTFDAAFGGGLFLAALVLGGVIFAGGGALWSEQGFWLACACSVASTLVVSVLGGLLVRCNSVINDDGYVLTTISPFTSAIFYTRALLMLVAWIVPVVATPAHSATLLQRAIADWCTLMGFLPAIKPLRERCLFFMLQFGAIDLPSERPRALRLICGHTLLVYAYQLVVLWALQRA